MSKWKPNKDQKVMVYFDLKRGIWMVDLETMKKAIKKGLPGNNIRYGAQILKEAYAAAKQELADETN